MTQIFERRRQLARELGRRSVQLQRARAFLMLTTATPKRERNDR
jgi:hypothetical protein